MRRATALRLLGGGLASTLAACGNGQDLCYPVPSSSGSASALTRFGCTMYSLDDVNRALNLISGCGSSYVRIGLDGDVTFTDVLMPAAAKLGLRVLLISPYASQPVDVAKYAANCAAIHRRYAKYNPIWEIWNEPNLAQYWGAEPNVYDYLRVAIPTAKALRAAGATDVWSGGTSGIDVTWSYPMKVQGAFAADVMNGAAVHSYEAACAAYPKYVKMQQLLPPGIPVHTTEACVPSTADQDFFLRQMWNVHRILGVPTLIWCELRDGTAGTHGPYAFPYGLVYSNYSPKSSYFAAKAVIQTEHLNQAPSRLHR